MNKKKLALKCLTLLAAVAALQACGGGGDGGEGASPAEASAAPQAKEPSADADAGSVAAKFVPNEFARSMLLAAGSQSFGNKLTEVEQADSGAVTRLGTNTLSGASTTVNIAGDANFALGRWVKGTVTRSSGAETLTGDDARSYHYVAFNGLAALPTSGAVNCTSGAFTEPTYMTGATAAAGSKGSASGSASVSFSDDGGAVQGSISVTVGGQTVSVGLPASITSPSSTVFAGAMLANGPGAALAIADQGDGTYALVVGYAAQLQSGARYTGVARLACTNA